MFPNVQFSVCLVILMNSLLARLIHPHISVQSPMQLWQKWDEVKKQKLGTPKLNRAPYHIISQCFNVYVLLEGGHSVKKQDPKEKWQHRIARSMYPIWSEFTCTVSPGYCLIFSLRTQIRFPINKFTRHEGYSCASLRNTALMGFLFSSGAMSISWILYMCRMWQYLMIPNNNSFIQACVCVFKS